MKYYHVIFICLLVLLYQILIIYRNNVIVDKVKRQFKPYHKTLSNMLRTVLPIFDKIGIKYCLYSGTLLGYARHNKSYIPWDDDVDLAVFREFNFKDKLSKLQYELKQYNMSLNPTPFGYNITQRGKTPYIDLFIFKEYKNKKYLPNEWSIRKFPKEYFYYNEIFPMIKDTFDNIPVYIPKGYNKFLKRAYGKDYLKNYKLMRIHHADFLDNIIIYITQRISIPS